MRAIKAVLLAQEEALLIAFLVQVLDIFNPLRNHALQLVTQINTNQLILINASVVIHRVLLVLDHQMTNVNLAIMGKSLIRLMSA